MKEQIKKNRKSFFKKIFIKICRILGYEIIDQGNFYIPTQEKYLNDNLSVQGTKSINLPLGEIRISRKVSELTVIFRSCTSVNMLTQNKKRLFDSNKSEYTFRSLNSLLTSLNLAKNNFPKINFKLIIVDHNSKESDLKVIKNKVSKSGFYNSILSLDVNDFKSKINLTNAKNEIVTENQISNMSNIYKSLEIANKESNDLIYFVEDDYIHHFDAISEMILTYERVSSQLNKELFLCPVDYPYLYTKLEPTNIFLGSSKHWRMINETLCTFLTSKILLKKYWQQFISMCEFEHYPFEKPLHDIYKKEICLSPISSLAIHCTNVNSVFGLSPNVDWKKLWDKSKDG